MSVIGMKEIQVPEVVEVANCTVTKQELPGGGMKLVFLIPGIKGYSFTLDGNGRKYVAQLCGLQVVGDVNHKER